MELNTNIDCWPQWDTQRYKTETGPGWIIFKGATESSTQNDMYLINCSGGYVKHFYVTVQPNINPLKVALRANGNAATQTGVGPISSVTLAYDQNLGRHEDLVLSWEANQAYSDLQCTLRKENSGIILSREPSGTLIRNASNLLYSETYGKTDQATILGALHGRYSFACTGRGETALAYADVSLAPLPIPTPAKIQLKVNGQSGTVTLPSGTDALLTWAPDKALERGQSLACKASGDWSGDKPNSGQQFTGRLYGNKTYTMVCKGSCLVANSTLGVCDSQDTVTIYVGDNTIKPPQVTKPTITIDPQDQSVTIAQTATFSCSASGDGVSYKWQYRNPGESAFTDISGGTGSTYVFKNPGVKYNGVQYRCIATNSAGSDTSLVAILTITESKSTPVVATCDATAKAVVTALGGCSNVDKTEYKNVYGACCTLVTKTTLLQILNDALADGVIDATEKKSLLSALNSYLSK